MLFPWNLEPDKIHLKKSNKDIRKSYYTVNKYTHMSYKQERNRLLR